MYQSKLKILGSFREQLISFLDELIEQFPEEGDLVVSRIFLKDQVPIAEIMDYTVENLLPLRHKVKNRNEDFFLNDGFMFCDIDESKVVHFKRLWKSNDLDIEDREAIWKWFDLFILLCDNYKKLEINLHVHM